MSEYAHMRRTTARRSSAGDVSQDTIRPSRASRGHARAADAGLAAALHGTAQVRSLMALQRTLDASPRMQSQRALQRALNPWGARPVQRKPLPLGPRAPANLASGPVVQRLWFDTGQPVMGSEGTLIIWMEDDSLPVEERELTGKQHSGDSDHPAGPVWRMKESASEQPIGEQEPQPGAHEGALDTEPVWVEVNEPEQGIQPGNIGLKVATGATDRRPTEAWTEEDFHNLGWDQPLSQARVFKPREGHDHVTFWCKVGDIDVMVHLTREGYTLIYRAGGDEEHPERNAPAEKAVDVTKRELTGKDLYTEFLRIATAAGGYREGANECQTFANSMLESLTEAVKEKKEEAKEQTTDADEEELFQV